MPIPVPHRPSGFKLGDPNAAVTMDIFFDIQCPHSRHFWPTLLELMKRYDGKPFNVTAHLITVSNHHQAWTMSLALMAIAQGDAQRFFDFTTYLFERQDQFMNGVFRHKTLEDQRQLAADFANDFSGIDRDELLNLLDDDDVYINARTPIRYAATRAVWATPTTFINNADDFPLGFRSSYDEWAAYLDKLMP